MKKLTEQDYIQALDYSNVLINSYSAAMEKCRAIKQNKELASLYDNVLESMVILYQAIGKESVNVEKRRNRK